MEIPVLKLKILVPLLAISVLITASTRGVFAQQTPPISNQIPRTSDGKPNLSGFWQVIGSAADWNIQDHSAEKGIPGGQGIVVGNEIPYQPWALEKKKTNYENRATVSPDVKSFVPGVPRLTYTPFPFQIVQTSKEVAVLYEYVDRKSVV